MTSTSSSFLRPLNLYGLDHLEAVLLAALASEAPLLLIGAHGTAKSALLNRVAGALGLEHRHYNASLISFDDLLGFPVPNAARDGIQYLDTPESIWSAQSVFLDEISRCRPEVQNKLFSLVHERRIQGRALSALRFRWAAMNPPPCDIGVEDGAQSGDPLSHDVYEGSLPLDAALADRFPFVVAVPGVEDLSRKDRLALIASGAQEAAGGEHVGRLVDAARTALGHVDHASRDWVCNYVEALLDLLRDAGLAVSGRRAGYLFSNALAITAANAALERAVPLEDDAFLALKWGLPQRARGTVVDEAKLHAIHRAAVTAAGAPTKSVWHALRAIRDPLERLAHAVGGASPPMGLLELSSFVSDAWAGFTLPQRYVLSRHLLYRLSTDRRVTVPCYEAVAEPVYAVQGFVEQATHKKEVARQRVAGHQKVITVARELARQGEDGVQLGNTLLALAFTTEEVFEPAVLVEFDRKCRALFVEGAAQASPAREAA